MALNCDGSFGTFFCPKGSVRYDLNGSFHYIIVSHLHLIGYGHCEGWIWLSKNGLSEADPISNMESFLWYSPLIENWFLKLDAFKSFHHQLWITEQTKKPKMNPFYLKKYLMSNKILQSLCLEKMIWLLVDNNKKQVSNSNQYDMGPFS